MSTSGRTRQPGAARLVFRRRGYVALAAFGAGVAYTAAVWFPNLELLRYGLASGALSGGEKAELLLSLWGSIGTNFSAASAALVVIGSALFGVSLAMAVFVTRRRAARARSLGAGLLGFVAGAFGLGCAACGSALLLSAFLPFLGLASIIPALPLHGAEFGVLGVLVQLVSIRLLANDVLKPATCAS